MAQKFGNFRWVKDGYLDNRTQGVVVGQMTFAGLGLVDFCLAGQFSGEISGQVIRFQNSKFLDDGRAIDSLADLETPQIGKVSLISFDPHPLLSPHPYIEWFSRHDQHYRIELEPHDAHIVSDDQLHEITPTSTSLLQRLQPLL
ncbi:MAG: hypothetical protein MRJ96_13690 [Nitrospirales bacterium]|nr:hypothetical protein [Nitrospira sp.]MDR4502497.1 hypothetical protein [Nitrospirales bacterium]